MTTWKEFDQLVEKSVKQHSFDSSLLKVHMSVCFVKNKIDENFTLKKIQTVLESEFNVNYNLSEIEDELLVMKHVYGLENIGNTVKELEEDFFDGF